MITEMPKEKEIKDLITETEVILSQQAVSYRKPFGLHLQVEFVIDPVTKENKIHPRLISSYAIEEIK